MNFINNTADYDGAAIYITDLERCTYAPNLPVSDTDKGFNRSIFKVHIFNFTGNRVLRADRNEQDVATAPSYLMVEPMVRR